MTEPTTEADKPARILRAALEEFAEKGYRAASTNRIAGQAGVAKGLVFHYFGNKQALYLAVYDWIAEELMSAMEAAIAEAPADLFERVFQVSARKLALMRETPLRTRFALRTRTAPREIRALLHARSQQANQQRMVARLLEGVDTSQLRPGVSKEEAMEAIMTISAGLENMVTALLETDAPEPDLQPIFDRSRRLLILLRDGLYGSAT